MAISSKVKQQIGQGSWIRRMFEEGIALKKQYGEANVFDLSLGNPVMEPPEAFRQELRRWAANPVAGMHRYMPNTGYPETRAAVAAYLRAETGLAFNAEHIVMSCGAGGGMNVALKTILNPGDEVVIFAPYFAEYIFYIDNHQGVCRVAPTDDRFLPDLNALEALITPRTRAVVINSPNNPSGAVYGGQLLADLGELLRRRERQHGTEIFLLSDEPYRKLVYDGASCPYVFHYYAKSIVVTSHSKDLALPGERIGYIAAHPEYEGAAEIVDGLAFCTRTLGFVNAPALMQHVVHNLLGVSVDVGEYQRKRDFLYANLTEMGYSLVKPQGTFYMFPRSPIEDVAFVHELQGRQVLTVPGSGFGTPGHFRISFCVTDATIEGSLAGFREVARRFGLC